MAQAARKQREIIDTQKKDNEAWYNRNYYEDSTQRSDAQRAMQMARDAMKSRYNQAQPRGWSREPPMRASPHRRPQPIRWYPQQPAASPQQATRAKILSTSST